MSDLQTKLLEHLGAQPPCQATLPFCARTRLKDDSTTVLQRVAGAVYPLCMYGALAERVLGEVVPYDDVLSDLARLVQQELHKLLDGLHAKQLERAGGKLEDERGVSERGLRAIKAMYGLQVCILDEEGFWHVAEEGFGEDERPFDEAVFVTFKDNHYALILDDVQCVPAVETLSEGTFVQFGWRGIGGGDAPPPVPPSASGGGGARGLALKGLYGSELVESEAIERIGVGIDAVRRGVLQPVSKTQTDLAYRWVMEFMRPESKLWASKPVLLFAAHLFGVNVTVHAFKGFTEELEEINFPVEKSYRRGIDLVLHQGHYTTMATMDLDEAEEMGAVPTLREAQQTVLNRLENKLEKAHYVVMPDDNCMLRALLVGYFDLLGNKDKIPVTDENVLGFRKNMGEVLLELGPCLATLLSPEVRLGAAHLRSVPPSLSPVIDLFVLTRFDFRPASRRTTRRWSALFQRRRRPSSPIWRRSAACCARRTRRSSGVRRSWGASPWRTASAVSRALHATEAAFTAT